MRLKPLLILLCLSLLAMLGLYILAQQTLPETAPQARAAAGPAEAAVSKLRAGTQDQGCQHAASLAWPCSRDCPPLHFPDPQQLGHCRPLLDCIEIARDVTDRQPLATGGVKVLQRQVLEEVWREKQSPGDHQALPTHAKP